MIVAINDYQVFIPQDISNVIINIAGAKSDTGWMFWYWNLSCELYPLLLSRRSRQRERLSASVLSTCSSVCLFVCRQNATKRDFLKN